MLIVSAPAFSDSVAEAIAGLRGVIEALRTQGPSEADVQELKRVALNSWPLRFETLGGLVTEWSTADHYGLGHGSALRVHRARWRP